MVYGRLKFIMKRSVLRKVRHLIVTSHQKRKKAEVGLVVGDLVSEVGWKLSWLAPGWLRDPSRGFPDWEGGRLV